MTIQVFILLSSDSDDQNANSHVEDDSNLVEPAVHYRDFEESETEDEWAAPTCSCSQWQKTIISAFVSGIAIGKPRHTDRDIQKLHLMLAGKLPTGLWRFRRIQEMSERIFEKTLLCANCDKLKAQIHRYTMDITTLVRFFGIVLFSGHKLQVGALWARLLVWWPRLLMYHLWRRSLSIQGYCGTPSSLSNTFYILLTIGI